MPMILDGKKVAENVYAKLALDLSLLPTVPKIVFILVGSDPASQTYVKSKAKKCLDLGIRSETVQFADTTPEEILVSRIRELNIDADTHGVLVQLPLPAHISRARVVRELNPLKDVDGLHPENAGRLFQGDPRFVPCTPAGILEILKFHSVALEGSHAVIVGRSEIVGKPVSQLLLMQNSTVTLCHSKTKELERHTRSADILIVAMGKLKFVGATMVKEGATVIDVGIHRVDGNFVGDVDFEAVLPKVHAITPVPGGVGPMTIAMLMKNLIQAATLQVSPKAAQR